MKHEDYLTERVQGQIDWFTDRAAKNRRMFERLRTVQIIVSSIIPFLSGIVIAFSEYRTTIGSVTVDYQTIGTVAVGALGVIVAVVTGVLSLKRYRENWIEYRKTCETLQREKYLYEFEIAPYNRKNRFDLLVQNVEGLLAKENMNWSQYVAKPDTPEVSKSH